MPGQRHSQPTLSRVRVRVRVRLVKLPGVFYSVGSILVFGLQGAVRHRFCSISLAADKDGP